MLVYLAQLLNMAFPKAGIVFHSIPVTVATIAFLGALLLVFNKKRGLLLKSPRFFWPLYLSMAILIITSMALNISMNNLKQQAVSLVILASPLALILGLEVYNVKLTLRIVAFSLIITGTYALIQCIWGLEATTIHGLNLALGDSWLNKPIGIMDVQTMRPIKWPGTYQNGNLVAAFYIIAIPLLLVWRTKSDRLLKYLALVIGIAGLVLSGARSAIYPFLLALMPICVLYVLLNRRRGLIYLLAVGLGVSSFLGSMTLVNLQASPLQGSFERYVTQSVEDPTANGRTVQWLNGIKAWKQATNSLRLRIIIFGNDWSHSPFMEGLPGMAMNYGLISTILFVLLMMFSMYVGCCGGEATLIIGLGLLGGMLQFFGDSPYCQPPTLINWFFVAGIMLNPASKNLIGELLNKNPEHIG